MSIASDSRIVIKNPREIKPAAIDLCIEGSTHLRPGQQLNLTTRTCKRSTLCIDSWTHAKALPTTLNPEGSVYESCAVFTAMQPGIYLITYNIAMFASKNGFSFFGSVSVEVVVE